MSSGDCWTLARAKKLPPLIQCRPLQSDVRNGPGSLHSLAWDRGTAITNGRPRRDDEHHESSVRQELPCENEVFSVGMPLGWLGEP